MVQLKEGGRAFCGLFFFCAIRYFFHFLPELPLRYSIVFQNFPVLPRKPYNYCDKNGARKHTLCLLAMGFPSFKWNTKQKIWHKMGRRKSIDSILCQKFKALGGEQTTNRFLFITRFLFVCKRKKPVFLMVFSIYHLFAWN